MEILGKNDELKGVNLVAGIGFYDGVHLGHQSLIRHIVETARLKREASAVITFRVHPRKVLNREYEFFLIDTLDERLDLLASTGLDYCVLLDFTPELATLSARDFLCLLYEKYGVNVLFVGYDHRFGRNRSEGFDDYVRYGQSLGIEVIQADAFSLSDNEGEVSSSGIRRLIEAGKVESASRWLGRKYCLAGEVVAGKQLGHTIGFPTANLKLLDPEKIVPRPGVYAVCVRYGKRNYNGMLNIGYRPTVDQDGEMSIEVHLFDFEGMLYGQILRVCFVAYLRPERKLPDIHRLVQQLKKDKEHALSILLT